MTWPGSTAFDASYYCQKTANFSAFFYALNNLHKVLDDDGTGVAPSVDLVSPLPTDNDYFAGCDDSWVHSFGQPFTAGGAGFPPGKRMYSINTIHLWIDTNMSHFIVPMDYVGKSSFTQWSSYDLAPSVKNLYRAIGVIGRDTSGLQSGFTRKRPAWINSPSFPTFADSAGNDNNVPILNDVAYLVGDGHKYIYNGGGSWSALGHYDQTPVRTLTGCGLPRIGDYYTYPQFWQELYNAINLLKWTYAIRLNDNGIGYRMGAAVTNALRRYGSEASVISLDNAKALAMADYTGSEPGGAKPIRVQSLLASHTPITSPSYAATIERVRGHFDVQGAGAVASTAPLLSRSFHYYYISSPLTAIPLDDLDTLIDISGSIAFWTSEGPTAAVKTESTSTFLDGAVDPSWPTIVTVNTSVEHDLAGGVQIDPYTIVHWDVPGGLPYLGGGAAEFAFWSTEVAQFM